MSLKPTTRTILKKMKTIKNRIASEYGGLPSRTMLAHQIRTNRWAQGSKAARDSVINANTRKKKSYEMISRLQKKY